jgi:hypothetical protein
MIMMRPFGLPPMMMVRRLYLRLPNTAGVGGGFEGVFVIVSRPFHFTQASVSMYILQGTDRCCSEYHSWENS